MTERKERFLSDLYEFRAGLSKPRAAFGSGYPFLSFRDVFHNFFVPENLSELVESSEKERNGCSIRRGDVFLTRTSESLDELGMSSVALSDFPCATFNGFTKRLRPKESCSVCPTYAGFYFRSPQFRAQINSITSMMSTRASLNNEMLARLKMVLPPLEEQKRIGETLLRLNHKIELNRQTARTLEELAQRLFKSWFVDFDPVRAKMAGRQPAHMPPETAALFPDKLVDSSLGPIPEGWDVVAMSDRYELKYGKALKASARVPGPTPVVGSSGTVGSHDQALTEGPGIVIGRKGQPGLVHYIETDFYPIDTTFFVNAKQDWGLEFAFWHLRSLELRNWSTDSAVPGLSRKIAYSIPVLQPQQELINKFDKAVTPLRQKLVQIKAENGVLVEVRDRLLPKLISGEIRAPLPDNELEETL